MDVAVVQRARTTVTQQSTELGDTRRIRIVCPLQHGRDLQEVAAHSRQPILEQQITPVATRSWTSPAASGEP
jgi:hypothetical protein